MEKLRIKKYFYFPTILFSGWKIFLQHGIDRGDGVELFLLIPAQIVPIGVLVKPHQLRGHGGEGLLGLPLRLCWERIHLQCGRPGFDIWVGKIP